MFKNQARERRGAYSASMIGDLQLYYQLGKGSKRQQDDCTILIKNLAVGGGGEWLEKVIRGGDGLCVELYGGDRCGVCIGAISINKPVVVQDPCGV